MGSDKMCAVVVGFIAVFILWPKQFRVPVKNSLQEEYDYVVGKFLCGAELPAVHACPAKIATGTFDSIYNLCDHKTYRFCLSWWEWVLTLQKGFLFILPRCRHRASRIRDLIVVEVSSPTAKKCSCLIPQLSSRPKVSKSRCVISQEPFLQRG